MTGDTSLHKVSLGRPWSPTASVTYLNCWLGPHIIEEGWNNWKNPANELTARYAEYNSSGPGANKELRVKWSKQLSEEEASKYKNRNEFQRAVPAFYYAACKFGWLDDVCSHMEYRKEFIPYKYRKENFIQNEKCEA